MRYESIESKILEFKERLEDYSRLLETVVAFANTQGGTIIIGIRDSDRVILGLNREEIERYSQEIPQVIADAVSPQIAVDLYEQHLGGNTCVTIRVFPGPQKPYFLKDSDTHLGSSSDSELTLEKQIPMRLSSSPVSAVEYGMNSSLVHRSHMKNSRKNCSEFYSPDATNRSSSVRAMVPMRSRAELSRTSPGRCCSIRSIRGSSRNQVSW